MLYLKADAKANTLLCFELHEGHVAEQARATLQLPAELNGAAHLSSFAAGDGSLLVCAHE